MTHHHMDSKQLLLGAVVGSLLGSVGALLVAPKSGKKLRQCISDKIEDISDKTHELTEKGRCLAKSVSCQTNDWAKKARCAVDYVRGHHEEEENGMRELLIGGVAGGILGAVVGLMLAPKPGDELRQDLVDTFDDMNERTHHLANNFTKQGKAFVKKSQKKANRWLEFAKNVVEDFTEEAEETSEKLIDKVKDKVKDLTDNDRVHEMMDWASLGYRVWQEIKNNR